MAADYYGYIYRTTNLVNGSTYVGQHSKSSLNENYLGSGKILHNAIKKYGKDNFKVEAIYFCMNQEELNEKEIFFIAREKKINKGKCYNLAAGGYAGHTTKYYNEEQLIEHRKSFQGDRNGMYGKGHLVAGEKNGFYGKTHSDDSKLKMSRDRKGHKNARSRMILVDFVETNCKMIFSTMKDAIMVLGSNRSTITHHAKTGKIRKNIGCGRKSIAPHYISYMEGGN